MIEARRILAAAVVLAAAWAAAGARADDGAARRADALVTAAERSGFRATALHREVVATLDALAAASPLARRVTMGKTVEGREIPVLVMADPPVGSAAEAREAVEREGRLLILAIGNIHAGEVEGKEALPMLARELLGVGLAGEEDLRALLRRVIVAIAPIYNADGNERVSRENRPGQDGPVEGMGVRENAQGFDLNRDFVKLEAPETRALVRFFNEWDPHVFVDCHTTNGSLHRYVMTYAGPKMPAGDAGLNGYAREAFFPAVARRFEGTGGRGQAGPWRAFWYGSFEGAFSAGQRKINEHERWETFPAEARYGTNYVGLRNRLSVLSEAYAYAPFEERVRATRAFVRAVLEEAAASRGAIRAVLAGADRRAVEAGEAVGEVDDRVAIRTRASAWPGKVEVLGYEEALREGRVVSTGVEKTYAVELWDRYEGEASVERPWGYVIARAEGIEPVLEVLAAHGIESEEIEGGVETDVVGLEVVEVGQATRRFQGHVIARIGVAERPARTRFGNRAVLVRTGQRLGSLACYLLEPGCEDGLGAWNFYDRWLRAGETLPVYRVMKPIEGR